MVMKMHRHGNAQMTGRILCPGTQLWPQDNYWRNWYKVISFIHQSADDHFNEIHSKYSNDYCSICKWIENSSKVFWFILVIIIIIILLLYIIIIIICYYYYYMLLLLLCYYYYYVIIIIILLLLLFLVTDLFKFVKKFISISRIS